MEAQGIFPDPSAVYFPLLTGKLQEKDRAALKAAFARPGFAKQIDTIEERAKELGSQLASKAAAMPSDAWKLLREAEPELVLWLAFHVRSGAVQAKIKAFLREWPQMRQKIPYALMQEMRITPDLPEYDKLLDDLFFALIDGKLEMPEATRAFLEPYSPPAPPQISVRKRPAKAARGRGKKAAATKEARAEALEDEDTTEIEAEEQDEEEREELAFPTGAADEIGGETSGELSADDHAEEDEEEPEAQESAAPVEPAVPAAKAVGKKVTAPKVASKEAATKSPVKSHAAEKAATTAKSTGSRPGEKGAHPFPPGKKAAAKKVASSKITGKVTGGKIASSKSTAATKATRKVATKVPAKNGPAKKAPAKKLPTKKVAVQPSTPARGKAVAKTTVKAVKAGKKAAGKSQSKH